MIRLRLILGCTQLDGTFVALSDCSCPLMAEGQARVAVDPATGQTDCARILPGSPGSPEICLDHPIVHGVQKHKSLWGMRGTKQIGALPLRP